MTAPPPLDSQLPAASPHEYIGGNPGAPDDYDGDPADSGTSVHGAFTTGVGYSKAYGNSSVSAAELDVTKHYDNGKTIDTYIDVTRSTGVPTIAPRRYGDRTAAIDRRIREVFPTRFVVTPPGRDPTAAMRPFGGRIAGGILAGP